MTSPLHRLTGLAAGTLTLVALLLGAAGAQAADYVPGEVVVTPDAGTPARGAVARSAGATRAPGSRAVTVKTRAGESVGDAVQRLRRTPGVKDAVPNYIAKAAGTDTESGWYPNDPGLYDSPGAWKRRQWNFTGRWSVNAPQAWANLRAAGRPGGKGVLVAVLDTGIAYSNRFDYERSPDFGSSTFVRGRDFIAGSDFPRDRNGHGTHVASTIAEATDNALGMTGLAYGAKILPVRVLDDNGEGDADTIAKGVRYAVDRGAKIINMSLEFAPEKGVPPLKASDIPQLISAIEYAHSKDVLVVAASGNEGAGTIDYPAKASYVMAVGATTSHGCISSFSNVGKGLDIVAPGGGKDAANGRSRKNCRAGRGGKNIFQMTFLAEGEKTDFGFPDDYEGTSMAVPHVTATAALIIASGVAGANPTARDVEVRLKTTARDLGDPGFDRTYGTGLVDAGAATTPVAGTTPGPVE